MMNSCPITAMKFKLSANKLTYANFQTAGDDQYYTYCDNVKEFLTARKVTGIDTKERYVACRHANRLRTSYIVDLEVEM